MILRVVCNTFVSYIYIHNYYVPIIFVCLIANYMHTLI